MIFRIICFTLTLNIAFATVRVSTSLDALACGASPVTVGILLSLLALFPAFLSLFCGRWIDRAGGKKPVITGALLLLAGTSVPFVFATKDYGLAPLFAAVSISGIGWMCVTMLVQQLVGYTSTPENRTTRFAWIATAYAVGGLVSPVITGYIIDHVGARWAFGFGTALCLVGFAAVLAAVSGIPSQWERGGARRERRSAFDILRIPRLRNVLIVSAMVSMAWDLQTFMFPVFGHSIGISATEIGWMIGMFYSATFMVRFLMPFLSKHFSEWTFLILAISMGAVFYGIFPFCRSVPVLMAVAFLLGTGLGASQPNVMSLLHAESPKGRVGEAVGLRTMITQGLHASLPLAFGAVAAAVGVTSIFLVMAGLMGSTAVLVRKNLEKHGKADREPVEISKKAG